MFVWNLVKGKNRNKNAALRIVTGPLKLGPTVNVRLLVAKLCTNGIGQAMIHVMMQHCLKNIIQGVFSFRKKSGFDQLSCKPVCRPPPLIGRG